MKIRIISALLTLVLVMGVMCSCSKMDPENDFLESEEDYDGDGYQDEQQDEDSEVEESANKKTTAAPDSNRVLAKELPSYEFVVSNNASRSLVRVVECISAASKEKWGTNGEVQTDDYAYPSKSNLEILIGETDRLESKSFISTLKSGEGGYAIKDNKIVIAGYSDEETLLALNMFFNNVMMFVPTKKTVYLTSKDNVKQDLTEYVSMMGLMRRNDGSHWSW